MTVGIVLLVVGGLLVVAEINTLTFYLLAVALACFTAGALAISGAGVAATFGAFGAVALLGLPAAHWIRRRLKNPEADRMTEDDVGHAVTVDTVESGLLRVRYRGSVWEAQLAQPAPAPRPGETLRIVRRDGNVLVVEKSG